MGDKDGPVISGGSERGIKGRPMQTLAVRRSKSANKIPNIKRRLFAETSAVNRRGNESQKRCSKRSYADNIFSVDSRPVRIENTRRTESHAPVIGNSSFTTLVSDNHLEGKVTSSS